MGSRTRAVAFNASSLRMRRNVQLIARKACTCNVSEIRLDADRVFTSCILQKECCLKQLWFFVRFCRGMIVCTQLITGNARVWECLREASNPSCVASQVLASAKERCRNVHASAAPLLVFKDSLACDVVALKREISTHASRNLREVSRALRGP